MKRTLSAITMASTLVLSTSAFAGWGSGQTSIAGKQTWLYTPDAPISGNSNIIDGQRALIINLHGCGQTATELKGNGNWAATAEQYGAVVAIPDVGNGYIAGCWNYNGGNDSSGHSQDLVNLTNALLNNSTLNIDPDQVYLTGLSSGAGIVLRLGCSHPDLFAGIGAVAGPTVGSSQLGATGIVPGSAAQTGKTKCTSLSNGKSAHIDTQIASLFWGMQDKDGPSSAGFSQGHKALVSVNWVFADVEVLDYMYGTDDLSDETELQGGKGYEKIAKTGSDTRLSIIRGVNIGHAWPADGGTNNGQGGDWINKEEFNYPEFVTKFFFDNNLRVTRVPQGPDNVAPVITLSGNNPMTVPQGGTFNEPGYTATDDRDGNITANVSISGSVNTSIEGNYVLTYNVSDAAGNPATPVSRTVVVQYIPDTEAPVISLNGDDPMTVKQGEAFVDPGASAIDNVDGNISNSVITTGSVDTATLGDYTIDYDVVDASGNVATTVTRLVQVVPAWDCVEYTASNYAHTSAGRATTNYSYAYAVGSGENMGLWNMFVTTTLAETSDGYFEIGNCP